MTRTAKRVAVFAATILVAAIAGIPLGPVAGTLVTTAILAIGLTVDDHVADGPAGSGDVLRRRLTVNIVMCGLAAVVVTVVMGPPGAP